MGRFYRALRITWVVVRYRLDTLIPQERLPWLLVLLLRLNPMRLIPVGRYTRGERLRLTLEELGPIFIKFGQMLSTRRDLLPSDVADELKKLQDQVPPFPAELARKTIEHSLRMPVAEAFAEFGAEPLASASVAQVHTARLHTGEEVVVKVIRPGIKQVIRKDIQLLYMLARLTLKLVPDAQRLHPVEVVADYEVSLMDELDLQKEAASTSQLKRNFQNSPLLYVPAIHWSFTRRNLMVQERIYGVPVAEVETLKARGVNMKKLAERGVEIFFTQVFRDNFFHADMHPGNIFVDTSLPESPRYIAIDCGIVGSLSMEDQNYLARNLLAFFEQDYYEVARLHIESGWVGEGTRANEFAAAIRAVCEPIFEKPLKDISFGQVLLGLFQTARRFNMEVQPQLVLLQKTLLNIEGLGRQLYPDLDLWTTAKPFLENWMKQRVGPRGILLKAKEKLPDWLEQIPELPQLAHEGLSQFRNWQQDHLEQRRLLRDMRDEMIAGRRRNGQLLLAVLLLLMALVSGVGEQLLPLLQGDWQPWVLGGIGLLLLLRR
ncbi:ubiquinone biosynthesis regulatory protein kinase UbiB [Marinospirillum alkaliphilum]|uniref:Probable protein kinase UbiB n=1 Tax=Marinospirillum alkaliphilum DSM 21637 TaxID=1122209 RepID=A0A1K1W820_9GAMM|nr:ubiquinone biosynthesis regulatory protein kinase UbiB [Marinospirillum alkaliphilum]SFX33512.1 2-octaprenylphenol hydroxylase [Marinospirillum alkaliphilum DSM 21637]